MKKLIEIIITPTRTIMHYARKKIIDNREKERNLTHKMTLTSLFCIRWENWTP